LNFTKQPSGFSELDEPGQSSVRFLDQVDLLDREALLLVLSPDVVFRAQYLSLIEFRTTRGCEKGEREKDKECAERERLHTPPRQQCAAGSFTEQDYECNGLGATPGGSLKGAGIIRSG
jgi:hypothetical protein